MIGQIRLKLAFVLCFSGLLSLNVSGVLAQVSGFFPSYFEVSGVAQDDVLNIRARPDASSAIVGSFAPGARPVEVLLRSQGWGYVSSGEGMGWVSMRFLEPVELPRIGESGLPVGLNCAGTEPFWGFELGESEVRLSGMNEGESVYGIRSAKNFDGRIGWDGFIVASNSNSIMNVVFSTGAQCSDGMSEKDFAWRVDMLITDINGTSGKTGCCSMVLGR